MLVTLAGMTISDRSSQYSNAFCPMLTTFDWIVRSVIFLQERNAYAPILVTDDGIYALVIGAEWKAPVPEFELLYIAVTEYSFPLLFTMDGIRSSPDRVDGLVARTVALLPE